MDLVEAKKIVTDGMKDGVTCPCCSQLVKIYTHKIDGAMARFMIWLARSHDQNPGWHNRRDAPLMQGVNGGGSYSKLRWWGLTESCPNTVEAPIRNNPNLPSNRSGYWRPTERGIEFAKGQRKVQKYVKLFDDQCYGWEGDPVNITDCLPEYFNFWDTWGY